MENKKIEHAELFLLGGIISSGYCMQIFFPQILSLEHENAGTNPSQNKCKSVIQRRVGALGAFDFFHCAELSSTVKLIRMASRGVVLGLAYLLVLSTALTTAVSQRETDNDDTSGVSKTQSKCHNVYTSNNFYAGPNKKIEAILLEVKEDLREIREEIKSLKENKTVEKGEPESLS